MKKSTLLMVLSLVLALALGVGGTMAYLQDTDEDVNVMTLGNVYIEQIEQEWNEEGELVAFTQGKPLYPGVYSEDDEGTDHRFPLTFLKDDEGNDMPEWQIIDGTKSKNAVDKIVTVKNTGKSDAYVRTVFAFEMDKEMTADPYLHIIINNNKVDKDITWTWLEETVEIGGIYYQVGVATYKNALAPGEISDPSLKQVGLMHHATNEICELFGETYDILVVSQAVQTMGFEDANENDTAADEALNAAFGEITVDNNPWKKNGENLDGTPVFPVLASNAQELIDGLSNGGNVTLTADIDLGDKQIAIPAGAEVTLNLGGYAITGQYKDAGHYGMITIPNTASLTVNGPGSMEASTEFTAGNRAGVIFQNAGKLEINGGTYHLSDSTTGQTWIIAAIIDNRTNSAACETVATINDGDFTVAGKAKNLFRNYPQGGGSATMIFNDGEYHANTAEETTYIWNHSDHRYVGELYFNGGTYDSSIVYEDYDGQGDIHIADGVTIAAYSGNN